MSSVLPVVVNGEMTAVITGAQPPVHQQPQGGGSMRFTYDPDADAAYVYFVDEIAPGGVDRTVPVDPDEVGGMINLDFDAEGHLLGMEILDASHYLQPSLLRARGSDGS